MTWQGLVLGFLLASLSGLLFHVVRGGPLSRLALYVVTAWISFFAGQFVSMLLGWNYWRLGTLNLFPALLATLLGLFASMLLAGGPSLWESLRERTAPHADDDLDM
jgi:hypothetical protein